MHIAPCRPSGVARSAEGCVTLDRLKRRGSGVDVCTHTCGVCEGEGRVPCSLGRLLSASERASNLRRQIERQPKEHGVSPVRNCGLRSSESHPPNLSISISGGRETNWDSLSNSERSWKLPRSEISSRAQRETGELWSREAGCSDAPLPSGPKSTWNGVPERVRAP